MELYYEIFKMNLKTAFRYRKSFLISILVFPLTQIMVISLLSTLYGHEPNRLIAGYTCVQMIWYFGATHFFYHLVWSFPDKEMAQYVISGEMATKLIQPISILEWEFFKSLAFKSTAFFFEFMPCLCMFMFMAPPDFLDISAFLKYMLMSGLAFLMFFLMNFILGTTAFLWQSTESLQTIKQIIIVVLAGASIPLEFFPIAFQDFIRMLPFQYLFYQPLQFLLNMPATQSNEAFIRVLGMQVVWILIFYLLARLYWKYMVGKYIAAGN